MQPEQQIQKENLSLAEQVALLPDQERSKVLQDVDMEKLQYDWDFWCRPAQRMPEGNEWATWLLQGGRGSGKTRGGAEAVRQEVESGRAERVALVAETPKDARDIMVEGPSGLLTISPPWFMPDYQPSNARLVWPNGAVAIIYSSAAPNAPRGGEHDFAWADEVAAWKYVQETWDNLMMGLRAGVNPRCVATTTPRPLKVIRDLHEDEHAVVTRMTSWENMANLTEKYYNRVISRYVGTSKGTQELEGKLLTETPGALWKRKLLDQYRVNYQQYAGQASSIVVGVDPAAKGRTRKQDEHGIVVGARGADGQGYTLEDCSMRGRPDEWAQVVVDAYHRWQANVVVAETNNGGDMVEHTIHQADPSIPVVQVHASRGKDVRAEPVSLLYEQGRIHHVGKHTQLEDQMCTWDPGEDRDSPDRVDALVWTFWHLIVDRRTQGKVKAHVG